LPPQLTIEDLKREHSSYPRNPLIANTLGLPEPEYKEEQGGFSVWFYKDIYTEDNLRKMGLNKRQIEMVKYMKKHKTVSLSSFKDIVSGVSEKTLYRDLQELVDRGLLKKIGEKKGRKYELS